MNAFLRACVYYCAFGVCLDVCLSVCMCYYGRVCITMYLLCVWMLNPTHFQGIACSHMISVHMKRVVAKAMYVVCVDCGTILRRLRA